MCKGVIRYGLRIISVQLGNVMRVIAVLLYYAALEFLLRRSSSISLKYER